MKYYLDTEFIEGEHNTVGSKKQHFVELISIGIVCEDGRSYYAVSNQFNACRANDWVSKNVLPKLPPRPNGLFANKESLVWKSNDKIKNDLLNFFKCSFDKGQYFAPKGIQVYGYFSAYDWFLFCSLFGALVNLPKNFPKYCHDLKQQLDEVAEMWTLFGHGTSNEESLSLLKNHNKYPKNTNDHHALSDAYWNRDLHNFLINVG